MTPITLEELDRLLEEKVQSKPSIADLDREMMRLEADRGKTQDFLRPERKPPPPPLPVPTVKDFMAEQPERFSPAVEAEIQQQREDPFRNIVEEYKATWKANPGQRARDLANAKVSDLFGFREWRSRAGKDIPELVASLLGKEDVNYHLAGVIQAGRETEEEASLGEKVLLGLVSVPKTVVEFGTVAGKSKKFAEWLLPRAKGTVKRLAGAAATFGAHDLVQAPRPGETLVDRAKSVAKSTASGAVVGGASKVPVGIRAPGLAAGAAGLTYAQTRSVDDAIEAAVTILGFEAMGLASQATSYMKLRMKDRTTELARTKGLEAGSKDLEAAVTEGQRIRQEYRETGKMPEWAKKYVGIGEATAKEQKAAEAKPKPKPEPVVQEKPRAEVKPPPRREKGPGFLGTLSLKDGSALISHVRRELREDSQMLYLAQFPGRTWAK